MAADKKRLVRHPVRAVLSAQDGTTIVSVIAAFVLLLIGISMFYAAILTAQRMLERSQEMDRKAEQTLRTFYEAQAEQERAEADVQRDASTMQNRAASTVLTLREAGGAAQLHLYIPGTAGSEEAEVSYE